MTIRYERSTFPGGYRPYDDRLNPQIDTLDTVGVRRTTVTLPPLAQSQRYVSRTVDLADSHPVEGPLLQLPRFHLEDVPSGLIELPSVPFRAPPPLSASSSSTNSPVVRPRRKPGRPRKTGNDKLTPSNLSLLDHRTLPLPIPPPAPGIDHLFTRPIPTSTLPRLTRPLPSKSPQMRMRQHTPPPPTPESPLFTSMVRAYSDRLVSAVKASCVQLLVKERKEKDALRRELDELKRLHLPPPPPHSAGVVAVRPRTLVQDLKRPSTAPPVLSKKRRFDLFEEEEATVVDDNWSRRASSSESVNSELTQVEDDGGAEQSFRSALDLGVYRKLGSSRASSRSSASSRGTVVGNNDVMLPKLFE